MADSPGLQMVGVVGVHGAAFADAVIAAQSEGDIVIVLRSADDAERIEATGVSRIVTPDANWGWVKPRPLATSGGDAPAQILFSSGTTGTPKGIVLTHSNIAATTDRLVEAMAMDGTIREYIGVPLVYSFGLGRARAVARAGGQYYVPQHGFDPAEIATMLGEGAINAISAVPTLWRMLLAHSELIGEAGRNVRWIEIGSQPMSASEKRRVRDLFPNARIVQHYGMTEASRTTFLHIDRAAEGELESVGRPMPGIDVAVGDDGRIRIRGPHVAAVSIKDGVATSLTDAEGWLTTDDLGRIEQDLLYFEGRADDLINCGGIKLHPAALEAAIADALPVDVAAHLAVARTGDTLRGEGIVVAFEKQSGLDESDVRRVANAVLETQGLHAGPALHVLSLDELPRTETDKVLRREIGAMITPWTPQSQETLESRVVELWRRVLRVEKVGPNDNFFDLGGDPLVGRTLVAEMVALGLTESAASGALDGMTIAEIIGADASPSRKTENDARDRLFALWGEALGRSDIDADKSFYDVGGDSLSAIGLALSMERAGFDSDTARAIFDGATISEIAHMADASLASPGDDTQAVQRPRVRTQVALLNEGLNLVKGLLITCIISSHWLPFYLDRAGLGGSPLHKALQPLLSIGSPTLAFCFGIGAAVFYARQYEGSGPAFRSSVRTGVRLLFLGLVLGFAGELGARLLQGEAFNAGLLAIALVSGPFLYFTLATASLPIWVPGLHRNWSSVYRTSGYAILFYALYEVLKLALPPPGNDQIAQAVNEVLIGHWSIFQMGAITLAGAAIGLVIELQVLRGRLSVFAPVGALLMVAGVVMALAAGALSAWFEPHDDIIPWAAVSYAGLALYIIARTEAWNAAAEQRPMLRQALRLTACLGILLFPLYVVQSTVYHGAVIINLTLGTPFLRTLTVVIALFLIVSAYALMRVNALYYGRSR